MRFLPIQKIVYFSLASLMIGVSASVWFSTATPDKHTVPAVNTRANAMATNSRYASPHATPNPSSAISGSNDARPESERIERSVQENTGQPKPVPLPAPVTSALPTVSNSEKVLELHALAQKLNEVSEARSPEALRSLENKYVQKKTVKTIGALDTQASIQSVNMTPGQYGSGGSDNPHSEYAKNRKTNNEAGRSITRYQGTIDTTAIGRLKVGDHFSLPINNTEQQELRVLSRRQSGKSVFLIAEPLDLSGEASFKLTPTGRGLRLFGTIQSNGDVLDFMSNDGQLLTVIKQGVIKQYKRATF